jgi:hypothetical protein
LPATHELLLLLKVSLGVLSIEITCAIKNDLVWHGSSELLPYVSLNYVGGLLQFDPVDVPFQGVCDLKFLLIDSRKGVDHEVGLLDYLR